MPNDMWNFQYAGYNAVADDWIDFLTATR